MELQHQCYVPSSTVHLRAVLNEGSIIIIIYFSRSSGVFFSLFFPFCFFSFLISVLLFFLIILFQFHIHNYYRPTILFENITFKRDGWVAVYPGTWQLSKHKPGEKTKKTRLARLAQPLTSYQSDFWQCEKYHGFSRGIWDASSKWDRTGWESVPSKNINPLFPTSSLFVTGSSFRPVGQGGPRIKKKVKVMSSSVKE